MVESLSKIEENNSLFIPGYIISEQLEISDFREDEVIP